jgi:hypothetical protein
MSLAKKTSPSVALLALCLLQSVPVLASTREADASIAACLKAWGDHPFGKNPQYTTLGTSAKVFGIGRSASDTKPTSSPSLVLINPIFNVMGESTIELLNPNGWYCVRTTVSILGKVNIRAHCKARLAATTDGNAALADKVGNRDIKNLGVTVIGSLSIERPCN